MHDSRVIANAILDRADSKGRPITNLDLQKILYFMHGHYLRTYQRPLVASEFEAWPYGPVSRSLYDSFKSYNDKPITERARAFDPVRRTFKELPELTDAEALSVLDEHLDYYLDVPTYLLVEFTHEPNTPWHRTVESANDQPRAGMKISNELIAQHFEGASPGKK